MRTGASTRGTQHWQAADWLVAVVIAILLFARLGAAPLYDVDEGAFSEATREMLTSGDYGSTTLNGAPRFDKPILVYWLQAASVRLFGINEFAFRLPSALCSLVWCGALWAFLRPRLGAATARLAALMLAASFGVLAIGRAATADALLNTLLALAMFDVWRVLEGSDQRGSFASSRQLDRAALRRAYAWVGLGLLAKGPVAALIPGAVSLLAALATGRLRYWRRAAFDPPGWALLLLIAAPWYVYILHRHGMDFVDGFLIRHNVARYTSSLEGHSGSLLYYLGMGPVLWLPWSGLLPALIARLRETWQAPLGRFMWLWAGFVVVFFSLSGTKLPHYLLYGSTPVLAGLAHIAVRLDAQPSGRALNGLHGLLALGVAAAGLALAAAFPTVLHALADRSPDPRYAALLRAAVTLAPASYLIWVGLAAAGWLAVCAMVKSLAVRWAAGGAAFGLTMVLLVAPWLGEVLQGPYREAAAVARSHLGPGLRDGAVLQWGVTQPSFSVYLGAVTPRGEPAAGQLALTRRDQLDRQPCADCAVLYESRGVVLVKRAAQGAPMAAEQPEPQPQPQPLQPQGETQMEPPARPASDGARP